ncbi:hypothetical protein CGLO_18238 [Colletotrichum gloeosporioides Cg-14]|uniref:Uncharacterized protein n=1 Tax=Colletotrichum gloeosporioides (strain Cg-14) TaxID=1237896 RepID=T0JUX0_COLGC|nr:hypothetical protein CGLO_18238 [Colletotrichum gloeosporioides Cg-14]
MREKRLTNLLL